MITKLSMLKQAALAVCCAAGLGAIPLAQATSVGISVGAGPVYYNGYYNPPNSCYYDQWGYYHCYPYYYSSYPSYYYGPYYGPAVTFGYYGGRGHRWGYGGWHGDHHWHR